MGFLQSTIAPAADSPPQRPMTQFFRADGQPLGLEEYVAVGGYQGLRKAVTSMTPADVIKVVLDSGLQGRGGAGFPAGRKWGFMPSGPDAPQQKYVVCNGDEMEPGAFKDRFLMERGPHQLIEGVAICAYACGASVAYIFIRAGYKTASDRVECALTEARAARLLGDRIFGSDFSLELRLHVSAGRYICGEASAMLNALEGERAIPRHKPPRQTGSGLWSRPTNVNNVETLFPVPPIVRFGADWFRGLGRTEEGGTKLYTVAGRVNRPGVWELPLGITVREVLEGQAGGMKPGHRLTGLLPGGASTPFLLPDGLDTAMDFSSMEKAGSRLGTATMIVLDDRNCPVGMLHNLQRFFAQESCGWCTPCWAGLRWVERLLDKIDRGEGTVGDLELLEWHVRMIKPGHTFCDLATGAMEPLESGLKHFRSEFERHFGAAGCPWKAGHRGGSYAAAKRWRPPVARYQIFRRPASARLGVR